MIVHGMRKGVPAQELRRFVPLYSNESDWKKLVNFSAPDDAYLIVATPDGHPVCQAHGPYSDTIYADLKKSVATLLEKSSTPSPKNLILTFHDRSVRVLEDFCIGVPLLFELVMRLQAVVPE